MQQVSYEPLIMSIMLIMSCYTGFFNVRRGWQSLNTGPRFYLRLNKDNVWGSKTGLSNLISNKLFYWIRDPYHSSRWVLDSLFSVGTGQSFQISILTMAWLAKIFRNVFWTHQIKLLQVSLLDKLKIIVAQILCGIQLNSQFLVAIDKNCIGKFKSNYNMIKAISYPYIYVSHVRIQWNLSKPNSV